MEEAETGKFRECGYRPRFPSADSKIMKLRYIYTMGFCAAIKRNEIMKFVHRWMELEKVTPTEVAQTRKDKCHVLSLICESELQSLRNVWLAWNTYRSQESWEGPMTQERNFQEGRIAEHGWYKWGKRLTRGVGLSREGDGRRGNRREQRKDN